jgi:hypothetical protein
MDYAITRAQSEGVTSTPSPRHRWDRAVARAMPFAPLPTTNEVDSLYRHPPPGYKRPPRLQVGDTRIFPLSLSEFLELSTHPHCNIIHLQYKETLNVGLLTYRRGSNQDKL